MDLRRRGTAELLSSLEPCRFALQLDSDAEDEPTRVFAGRPSRCHPTVPPVLARSDLLAQAKPVGPSVGSAIDILALHALGRMDVEDLGLMTEGLASLLRARGGIVRLATMCSGSDLIIPAAKQLIARMCDRCGLEQATVLHCFAVENHPAKRQFSEGYSELSVSPSLSPLGPGT